MSAGKKLAGGGGRHGAAQESRASGAGRGAEEKRGHTPAQEGLSSAETLPGDEDAALESGAKAQKDERKLYFYPN